MLRLAALERAATGIDRLIVQFLLDAQQLIVLGQPVRAGQRTSLDLSAIGRNRKIGDGGVLCLARAVADNSCVACTFGHFNGGKGLAQSANLVDFDEDGVGYPLVNAFL